MLWFDVGIKRYTTDNSFGQFLEQLWFDVGIKRYTTSNMLVCLSVCCGLMQESKDIQRSDDVPYSPISCGLMQESKDIQLTKNTLLHTNSCGLMQESKDIQLKVIFEGYELVVV